MYAQNVMVLCLLQCEHPHAFFTGILLIIQWNTNMIFPRFVLSVKDRFYLTPDNIPPFLTWVYSISPIRCETPTTRGCLDVPSASPTNSCPGLVPTGVCGGSAQRSTVHNTGLRCCMFPMPHVFTTTANTHRTSWRPQYVESSGGTAEASNAE